jgi:lactoylglutathione lyase
MAGTAMDLLVNIDVPNLAAAERFYVEAFGLTPTRRFGVEAALARAVAADAVAETGIRETVWGRIVVLADPFGHGLCLIQFLNRGYDEIATPL